MVRKGSLHQQLTWEGDSVRSQTPHLEPSSDISCSIPQKSPTLGGTTKGFKVLQDDREGEVHARATVPTLQSADRETENHRRQVSWPGPTG